ncbi:carbamoyl-phosphate synthase large subunit [Acidobacteria bacterium AH-259-D05]|nr:carbamoyl-phosphate synthase large subunit [Acidobacteria bacterium AH-259-D05]
MPKRTDIKKILIVGSGPIVIGQACEFDYSGTQACKAIVSDGFQVVLVNSNPATIMTDPEFATRTYIEPLTVEYVAEIIKRERPDALLPTVGGQTGLNISVELCESGTLEEFGVEMIGAKLNAIKIAEDRRLFRAAMEEIGLEVPRSRFANSLKEAGAMIDDIGLPAVIRPSYTLGGTGGGVAFNSEEFEEICTRGLQLSPIHEVLVEESIIGWKEFELEVMRDLNDNVVVICSIENVDPMGVHTGDSITVAPAQTLSDREYQTMRDAALAIIRKVGVETGGSNIQFATHPETGQMVVIEMNPRVSRSSALASKATGFPIAKIAAKLAVGYNLDEIPNDITLKTPACFEPTLDYVVVKIPKWNFEKFPETSCVLGTQMKSVGEVMAIGRTFREALLKGLRSQETGKTLASEKVSRERIRENLIQPTPQRLAYIRLAFLEGYNIDQVYELTRIDRWFLEQLLRIVNLSKSLPQSSLESVDPELIRKAKKEGLSDLRLAQILDSSVTEPDLWNFRKQHGILPVFKRVDTCGAEFESRTPYLYSTFETEDESEPSDRRKIIILGSGPNRIGQGIEFDYCCCHAAFALKDAGFETIMVNCNPETVSTDYDTSDRLYFEPLTFEDVMAIVENEKPDGVIVQFGGQTPLKLALKLFNAGVPIIGTSPQSIDLAEDRKRFGNLLRDLDIPQPENGSAMSVEEARAIARDIGYPVLVRPSYVLGGRSMAIIYDKNSLDKYVDFAVDVSPEHPVLIDRFLEDAREYDVDALADGSDVVIGGIMEHIEEAGIHSGDSTSVLPPIVIEDEHLEIMRQYTRKLGQELGVVGLMNIQFAVVGDRVYVLEVNPRASRTVPFVSKATGVSLAKVAAQLMVGKKLEELGLTDDLKVGYCFVKTPVFPFDKFPGVDTILGPEMKSTGEVMGVSDSFGYAYAKAQISAGVQLPKGEVVFISVNDRDKRFIANIARDFQELGFHIVATRGTAKVLRESGLEVEMVYKVNEGRPNVVDLVKSRKIDLVINSPLGRESFFDEKAIRRACTQYRTPCITTLSAAAAAVSAIRALQREEISVRSLQEYHAVERLTADS